MAATDTNWQEGGMSKGIEDALYRIEEAICGGDPVSGGEGSLASAVDAASRQLSRVSQAITADAAGGPDATGGHVESLTEAVMGVTRALTGIASAIEQVAEAISTHGDE